MDLQKLLSINVATLSALGTLLLAMGERNLWAPLIVWLCAIASVAMTDFAGWFRLNRNVGALVALAAVLFSTGQVLRLEGETRLLAMADLLFYLQIVLFFQKKDERVYWELAVISLLQVVVAARFSQGVGFGLLLAIYMLVGLSAMTLLFLYREWNRHEGDGDPVPLKAPPGSRWPLAAGRPVFVSRPAGESRSGVAGELFGRLGLIGAGTMVLALVIFFTVPRLGRPAWRGAMVSPRQVVGFSDTVALGSLGEILESREEVMRLQLIEPSTGRMVPVEGEPYLRGAVLEHYENNEWRHERPPANDPLIFLPGTGGVFAENGRTCSAGDAKTRPVPFGCLGARRCSGASDSRPRRRTTASLPIVLQRISVEPLDRDELFCIWPFIKPRDDDRIAFDSQSGRLFRRPHLRGKRFRFELNTTAYADGVQLPLVPCERPVDTAALLQLPALPRLRALATEWVAESGLPPRDRLRRARLLEGRLASSGRFQYSLQGQDRDLTIDAIEDFVSNNPRGHCEYFATALALMLRSQGVPSRVVIGYKCDEWNDVGKFFQVRQLHAHAWVEAYLASQHIPRSVLQQEGARRWAHGGWLRLDGTPAAETGTAGAAADSAWGRLRQRFDWLQTMWNNYVVEMDRQRQREAVYQPTLRALHQALRNLGDPQWWRAMFDRIAGTIGLSHWNSFGGWLLMVGLPLAVAVCLLAAAGWGAWHLARRTWRRLAARLAAKNSRSRIHVEFYRRFEDLLARRKIVRARGQTPRELARTVAGRILQRTGRTDLAALPGQIVDAYYRVRFGRQSLDPSQREALELAIRQADAAVA